MSEPKLSVPISHALHRRLQKAFPWGTQAAAIRRVVELLVDKVEADGYNTIHRLISGAYNPLDELDKSQDKEKSV